MAERRVAGTIERRGGRRRPPRSVRGVWGAEGRASRGVGGDEAPHFYSGMLPCFLRGLSCRLPRSISSERMRRGRVSSGRMTSST